MVSARRRQGQLEWEELELVMVCLQMPRLAFGQDGVASVAVLAAATRYVVWAGLRKHGTHRLASPAMLQEELAQVGMETG